jgi:hypothetical protein
MENRTFSGWGLLIIYFEQVVHFNQLRPEAYPKVSITRAYFFTIIFFQQSESLLQSTHTTYTPDGQSLLLVCRCQ